jgi:hypothetical protein
MPSGKAGHGKAKEPAEEDEERRGRSGIVSAA